MSARERFWRVLSPPGRGAIAAIGIEGPDVAPWLSRTFRPPPSVDRPTHGTIVDATNNAIDDGVWVPLGDGEGVLTIHGNPVLVEAVGARLTELGALERPDSVEGWERNGETPFAEAQQLLASAPTLSGALFLLGKAAQMIAWGRAGMSDGTAVPSESIAAALDRAPAALSFSRPPRIVLAGVPNAGKSTLFNRLVGWERVVVDPTPGTTRDRIEEAGTLADRPVRWIDGAGLREGEEEIEIEGVRRIREAISIADLVVLLTPPGNASLELDLPLGRPVLRIRSRADQIPAPDRVHSQYLAVSGRSGEGVDELRAAIAVRIFGAEQLPLEPTPITGRQVEVLREILRRRKAGLDERAAWTELVHGGRGRAP